MLVITTSVPHCTRSHSQCSKAKETEDWEGKRVAIIFRLLDFIHEKSKRIKAATYTVNLQKLFVFLYICSKPIILKKMIPFTLAYKKEYLKINIMKDFIIFINIM